MPAAICDFANAMPKSSEIPITSPVYQYVPGSGSRNRVRQWVPALFDSLFSLDLKLVLFPSEGVNHFYIKGEAPIGTSLERTNELILPVEGLVRSLPPDELDSFTTYVGFMSDFVYDPFRQQESNLVQVTVYLTPAQSRKRNVDEIIADIREKAKDIKGFE